MTDTAGGERRCPTRSDVALAGLLLAAGLVESIAGGEGGNRVIYAAGVVAATAPLAWRRAAPAVCAVAVAAALGVGTLLPTRTDDLLVPFIAWLVALFSLGLHGGSREFQLAVVATVAVISGPILLAGEGPDDVAYALLVGTVATAPARVLRHRLAEAAALAERAVRAEHDLEDRTRAAALEERNRLAREMHDIIGHGVSLMVVHAAAAEALLEQPEVAAKSLQSVQDTGRQAVADLARLLGLLREDHAAIGLAPQPDITDIAGLVEGAETSGQQVTFDVLGDLSTVAPTLGLTGYRIVQEGLTNARRHAPGAPVTVRVAVDAKALEIRVSNPLVDDVVVTVRGTGSGLRGLEERVRLFGGRLGTRVEDGEFVLHSRLLRDQPAR